MATRYGAWTLESAGSPLGAHRRSVRLIARQRHVLIPSRTAFEPPADVYITDDAVVIRLEIAGLGAEPKAINVELAEDTLTVSGVRPDPGAGMARQYEQMEIQTGRFQRTFELPCPVDETAAVARYDDGFLVVKLPRRSVSRPGAFIVAIE